MKIIKFELENENIFQEISESLTNGGAIVYPTDTLYGLGVNALDKVAVDKLFRIKKRPQAKPVPVIVRDIPMAKRFAYIDLGAEKILSAIWPGPVTAVLSRKDLMPSIVSGGKNTIGIRVPNSEFTKRIFETVDFPVTSTSINISGEMPLKNVGDILKTFGNEKYKPDIIIDAGDLPESPASTVIDLTSKKPRILRVGPVGPEELLKILEI